MIKIIHRINIKDDLLNIPTKYGVEVDIRSADDKLIISHDPFIQGEDFMDWMALYKHEILILNVKEEGLEDRLIAIMANFKVDNFFFLDQSFPFLLKTSRQGESRSAVRVSEFEDVHTAMNLAGKVQWVWVDCFSRFPLSQQQADLLQTEGGFKLCFVSPELQSRAGKGSIIDFRKRIEARGIMGDAVCTKYPNLWE